MGLIKRFVKGRIVRANEVGVDEFAPLSPQQLIEFLRNHLTPQGLTAGFGGMIALADGTIHHQDIRRTLGQPRTIPAVASAGSAWCQATHARAGRRIRDCDCAPPTSTGPTRGEIIGSSGAAHGRLAAWRSPTSPVRAGHSGCTAASPGQVIDPLSSGGFDGEPRLPMRMRSPSASGAAPDALTLYLDASGRLQS